MATSERKEARKHYRWRKREGKGKKTRTQQKKNNIKKKGKKKKETPSLQPMHTPHHSHRTPSTHTRAASNTQYKRRYQCTIAVKCSIIKQTCNAVILHFYFPVSFLLLRYFVDYHPTFPSFSCSPSPTHLSPLPGARVPKIAPAVAAKRRIREISIVTTRRGRPARSPRWSP